MRMRWLIAAAVAVTLAAVASAPASGKPAKAPPIGDGRGGVATKEVGIFDRPVYVARAPGVADTIYVVERGGTVRAVVDGTTQPQPFLDITALNPSQTGAGGLLSIAFDPTYQANGLLYTYYVNAAGDIEIDEFHAPTHTDVDEASRRPVITIPHPIDRAHYGGTIAFGPDGYLYAATGDGSSDSSGILPVGRYAQDDQSLLGKLLRIDPHESGPNAYTVPRNNPFVDQPPLDEIYAFGLRNPFRWSFDGSKIVIGDVGFNRREEIDYESRRSLLGANFGWNVFEGSKRFQPGPTPPQYEPPVFEYRHKKPPNGRFRSITGGVVVRDRRLQSLYGRYLYADYIRGFVDSLILRQRGARDKQQLFAPGETDQPVAIAEGPRHRVYIVSIQGEVYRLVPD
jgi:glucose/arabinose dehydrogenase